MQHIKSILIFFFMASFTTAALADQFTDAQAAYDQHDYRTALKLWQPLAAQGNANAQYSLGLMYDNGFGVSKDYRQAVDWFRRAAVQGNTDAERHYEADNFVWGLNLPKVAQAKASDKIVVAVAISENVPRKDIKHIATIEPAAGDVTQPIQLVNVATPTDQQATNPDISVLHKLERLAEQGNVDAQLRLGTIYALGKDVQQDYEQAVMWYKKAALQGNSDAQELLGIFYNSGAGVHQNYAEAARLYHLAADHGNANAQNDLGSLYVYGHGVPQDYEQAAQWYTKAAVQGNSDAQAELGTLYAMGLGVPQNYTEAKKWYNQAAMQGNTTAQDALNTINANKPDAPQEKADQQPEQNVISSVIAAMGSPKDRESQQSEQVTPSIAPQQISLATQQGFDVGVQASQYHYREQMPNANPFMEDWGRKFGVEAGYTLVIPDNWFLRGEGRFAQGTVNYVASNGIGIDGIPERTWEIRGLVGKDYIFDNFSLSPYTGYGFRHFWDNNGAGSAGPAGGYIRKINYQYIPLGLTQRFRLEGQARLATNFEYDQFLGGTVYSGVTDTNPIEGPFLNHQSQGMGARGSVLFEMAGWSAGPYFNYWHIGQSDVACTGVACVIEPENKTREVGLKIVKDFW